MWRTIGPYTAPRPALSRSYCAPAFQQADTLTLRQLVYKSVALTYISFYAVWSDNSVHICVLVLVFVGRIAQSVWRLAARWTVRGSNRGGSEIFGTCPDRPWGPPSLLHNGCLVFPRGKERPGRDADPSPFLVSWSRKGRAIPLLPLRAVRPVQSLSACTRVHFTFTFFTCIYFVVLVFTVLYFY